MTSVIVLVPDDTGRSPARESELLVRSLVWLVSAVVSGVVRDVTLAGRAGLDLAEVAEQSGCRVVEAASERERLGRALALSKGPRVLLIHSAYRPAETMVGELDSLTHSLPPDAALRLLAAPATAWQRLRPDAAPLVGLFAPLQACRLQPSPSFSQLVADLRPKRLFATRAAPVV